MFPNVHPRSDNLIFDAAVNKYQSATKKDLYNDAFATALCFHATPEAVLNLFRRQAEGFRPFREDKDKLMRRLGPIVEVLLLFSATLGGVIGLVSPSKSSPTFKFAPASIP